jgi:hypothetical protein
MDGEGLEDRWTEVDAYATAVVKNALKSNPTKDLWVGGNTFMIWLLDTFGWSSIWVRCSLPIQGFTPNVTTGCRHAEYVQDPTRHKEDTGSGEI